MILIKKTENDPFKLTAIKKKESLISNGKGPLNPTTTFLI